MSRQTRRCRCARCFDVFFTENPTKKYCSESCRKSAERARWWQKHKVTRALKSS